MSMKLLPMPVLSARRYGSPCHAWATREACRGENPARDLIVATATSDAKFVWKGSLIGICLTPRTRK
jgi:hypothetical protein